MTTDRVGQADDPFGTAELRSAVLAAWERSPARFREDANTEEDHGRGYYRDRVVVELAQNAADAAARLGEPGRLLLRLTDDGAGGATLLAANTGEALAASGVASLASLRASAKRPSAPGDARAPGSGQDTSVERPRLVGRFGVGFAAVRSVSDDVSVVSAGGGVRFSVEGSRAVLAGAVARSSGLRTEVEARGGSLPVLRLPTPLGAGITTPTVTIPTATPATAYAATTTTPAVPAGYTTAVVLRLRDAAALAAVRAQLALLDDALLLALPSLGEIRVETDGDVRVLADVVSRWIAVTRTGAVPSALLADRPVEERSAASWSVTWAVRCDGGGRGRLADDGVVHAPTPTDEPLTVPALLVASFPLDPSRRHVAPGALADLVASEAGRALADLALLVPQPLELVPTGLPGGRLDAELREAALTALRAAPILAGRLASGTVLIDGDVGDALVDALSVTGLGVVSVPAKHRAAARLLGATTMSLADVVDSLPAGLTPPQWWHLYDALAPYVDGDRTVREALGGILVPLADGTTTRGPRGLVVAGPAVAALGLRVVHAGAAHPVLVRLGALAGDDPQVLALPAVEAVARDLADDLLDSDVEVAEGWPDDLAALLALLAGVAENPEHRETREPLGHEVPSWVGSLPLPADDGSWRAADELAQPGSWAAEHLDLAVVDVPDRWAPLAATTARILGVREHLVVRTVDEHLTGQGARLRGDDDRRSRDENPDQQVSGWDEYDDYLTAVLGADRPVGDLRVVADLDVVHDDAWGAVVDVLTHEPDARAALLTPVRPLDALGSAQAEPRREGSGSGGEAPTAVSYTAWCLRDVLRAPFAAPAAASRADGVQRADGVHGAGADAGLGVVLPAAPAELAGVVDDRVLEALGAIRDVTDLETFLSVADPAGWDAFWSGLPEVGAPVTMPVARAVWSALATAAAAGLELDPLPGRVVALQGGVPRVVAADDVVVAGEPMWAQLRAVVPVADPVSIDEVADALDAAVADASVVAVRASEDTDERSVPERLALVVGRTSDTFPATWTIHDELVVDGTAVEWWVTTDGGVHVAASEIPEVAAARGLAQAAGLWASRHAIEIVLRDAGRAAEITAENAWDRTAVSR